MTISSQRTVHKYVGDGTQNKWPVLFVFQEPEDVKAIKTATNGVDSPLTYGSDYTIEKLGGGGARCTASIAKDEKITLYLDVPLTQQTDLRNAGKLSAEVIERMTDKLTLALQQQREDIGRCVRVSPTSTTTPEEMIKELSASAATAKNAKGELLSIKNDTLQLKNDSARQVTLAAAEADRAKTVVTGAEKLVGDANQLIKSAQKLINDATGGGGDAPDELLSGMVIPFKGTVNSDGYPVNRMTGNPDKKYALCDGRTYAAPDKVNVTTPDLRDKFITGAGAAYAQGATGGAATVTLTLEQIPAHTHSIRAYDSNGTRTFNDLQISTRTTTDLRKTTPAGGSQAHENLPPYYALAYLMKL